MVFALKALSFNNVLAGSLYQDNDSYDPEDSPIPAAPCFDTNYGAEGVDDQDCESHRQYPEFCGKYDDYDFKAHTMCCTCPFGGNRMEFTGATIVDSDTSYPDTNFHYAVPKDSETNDVETPVYCPPNFPYIDKKDNDNLGDRCLVQPQIPSHCLANSNPDDYSGKFCRMLDLTVSCKWTCPVGCYVDEPKTYNNCIMAGTKGESKLPCRVPESNIAEPEEEVECPEVAELISVDIKFYTGNYAEEVSWEIANTDCKSGGQYQDSYETHDIICQLPAGQQLLVCEDVYADGWNNGWIEILGEHYCETFDGEREEVTINVV